MYTFMMYSYFYVCSRKRKKVVRVSEFIFHIFTIHVCSYNISCVFMERGIRLDASRGRIWLHRTFYRIGPCIRILWKYKRVSNDFSKKIYQHMMVYEEDV